MDTHLPSHHQQLPTLDIIVPCYNASQTITRAVTSILAQTAYQTLYLVDDGSTDHTWQIIEQLQQQYPQKIKALKLATNHGVAMARNWAALHSTADLIAFLDADDAYQPHALDAVPAAFYFLPHLSMLRLRLQAVDLPERYTSHANFAYAWEMLQMTVGGNTVFRRSLFLLCGGFPQDDLFRRFGGEDGALGLALTATTLVGTLFDEKHAGVLHYYHEGMHAQRLLDAQLFAHYPTHIPPSAIAHANRITESIIQRIQEMTVLLQHHTAKGRSELNIEY